MDLHKLTPYRGKHMFESFFDEWIQERDSHVKEYFSVFLVDNAKSVDSFETEIARINMRMGVVLTHGIEFQYLWSIRDWFKESLVRWYALDVE
jgi:hypothetical protein